MMKTLKITFFLIVVLFLSCEKRVTELDFQKKVMTEIFPDLIDSTCIDIRLFTNFPPKYGKSIYDKEGHYIGVDSSKATNEEKLKLLEWKQKEINIKNDTSKIIIAFDPKIKSSKENGLKENFEKHFKGAKLNVPKDDQNTEYDFQYGKIKLNNKFKLKSISDFPNKDKIWETKYDFVFSGIVYFTKIEFDKDKKYGVLDGGFICGRLCGQGFRIYIKQGKEKWIIDKVEGTWIS